MTETTMVRIGSMLLTPQVSRGDRRLVIVVGAGGTGARVVPPLVKMLHPTDTVVVVDHDRVETRNLRRQHFFSEDVGRYKAEVVTRRAQQGDRGPTVVAWCRRFEGYEAITGILPQGEAWDQRILVGCVDNLAARQRMLREAVENAPGQSLYLDAGNATRDGQAIVAYGQMGDDGGRMRLFAPDGQRVPVVSRYITLSALPSVPAVFGIGGQRLVEEPEGCAERLDVQTVMVNQMAATAMINLLSAFLYGIPLPNLGCRFSTRNTMEPLVPTVWDPLTVTVSTGEGPLDLGREAWIPAGPILPMDEEEEEEEEEEG